jgi:histidine triad (HIT) family protein
MNKPSIFTKIINGEIPAHKIYEDEFVVAFLDIMPKTKGHTLVVSRKQIDKFYDLPDEDYIGLFKASKKIAKHMEETLGKRIFLKIIGKDVPHTHVHLIPFDPENFKQGEPSQANDSELAEMATKLKM